MRKMAAPLLTAESYELGSSIGYLMARSSRAAILRAEAAFGVDADSSFAELLVLIMLRDEVARRPGDLVEMLSYNSGTVTRLIDRIERRGFVKRVRSTDDRRSIDIRLTHEGRTEIDRLLPRLVGVWNDILGEFEQEEFEILVRLLRKLHAALDMGGTLLRNDTDKSSTAMARDFK